jgi:hypothetical protein
LNRIECAERIQRWKSFRAYIIKNQRAAAISRGGTMSLLGAVRGSYDQQDRRERTNVFDGSEKSRIEATPAIPFL